MSLKWIAQKIKSGIRGYVQRNGSVSIKKRVWDAEYASGKWDCLDDMSQDCVNPYIEQYAKKGAILDLGCGPGGTGNELHVDSYYSYTGVDISDVAIAKARARTLENQRTVRNSYYQADICNYVPESSYDVIVFGDSIYYFTGQTLRTLLRRYSEYLKAGGVFIAKIKGPYSDIHTILEREFSIVEKRYHFDNEVCVVVFVPKGHSLALSTNQ